MANLMTRGDLRHMSRKVIQDCVVVQHEPSSPTWDLRKPASHVPCGAEEVDSVDVLSDQEAGLRENPEVFSLSLSPVIQCLPNLCSDTPSVDKFPQHSARPRPAPLANSADAIRAFDAVPLSLIETPGLSHESNMFPHDSENSVVPLNDCSNQIEVPQSRAPAPTDGTVQPNFQRYRPKRRTKPKSLWPNCNRTLSCLSEGLVRGSSDVQTCVGMNGKCISPVELKDASTVQHCSVEFGGGTLNPEKQEISNDCEDSLVDSLVDSTGTSDGRTDKHRQALEQIVPEDMMTFPQNTYPVSIPTCTCMHRQYPYILMSMDNIFSFYQSNVGTPS